MEEGQFAGRGEAALTVHDAGGPELLELIVAGLIQMTRSVTFGGILHVDDQTRRPVAGEVVARVANLVILVDSGERHGRHRFCFARRKARSRRLGQERLLPERREPDRAGPEHMCRVCASKQGRLLH